jgi:hypothetical protein
MGAPASHNDALDDLPATRTRPAMTLVHSQRRLVFAGLVLSIAIVAQGCTSVLYSSAQDLTHSTMETLDILARECLRLSHGMNTSTPQGFIHVYVAEAGKDSLILEDWLDATTPMLQQNSQSQRRQVWGQGLQA